MVRSYHQLNGHGFEQTQEMVEDRSVWRVTIHGVTTVRRDLTTEQQQKVVSLSEKSSLIYLFIHPSPQLLKAIDLFTVSRVLPFPECHGVGTLWF